MPFRRQKLTRRLELLLILDRVRAVTMRDGKASGGRSRRFGIAAGRHETRVGADRLEAGAD